MNNNELVGITDLTNQSCAASTIQCLVDSGITDWQSAFDCQIENSKAMGQMPDDFKVTKETLCKFGFSMQSGRLEGVPLNNVCVALENLETSASVFVHVADHIHLGGYMIAFRTIDGKSFKLVSRLPKPNYLEKYVSKHVWIRWDDGLDRSPYPRKVVKRSSVRSNRISKKSIETECYKPFQPNPCANEIGDCVVRGISGALDMSWVEAVERLTSTHETTINAREVYQQVLNEAGFQHHKPIALNGRRLDGKAFCEEMNRIYHNGERIFAHIGRRHAVAIVPVKSDGRITYKIIDSWDSSKYLISDYWVLREESTLNSTSAKKTEYDRLSVGDKIKHPVFNEGTIESISSNDMVIDFVHNGVRHLSKKWVLKNCIFNIKIKENRK